MVMAPLASITMRENGMVNEISIRSLAPTVDFQLLQTPLGRHVTQEYSNTGHGAVWTVALLHDKS